MVSPVILPLCLGLFRLQDVPLHLISLKTVEVRVWSTFNISCIIYRCYHKDKGISSFTHWDCQSDFFLLQKKRSCVFWYRMLQTGNGCCEMFCIYFIKSCNLETLLLLGLAAIMHDVLKLTCKRLGIRKHPITHRIHTL